MGLLHFRFSVFSWVCCSKLWLQFGGMRGCSSNCRKSFPIFPASCIFVPYSPFNSVSPFRCSNGKHNLVASFLGFYLRYALHLVASRRRALNLSTSSWRIGWHDWWMDWYITDWQSELEINLCGSQRSRQKINFILKIIWCLLKACKIKTILQLQIKYLENEILKSYIICTCPGNIKYTLHSTLIFTAKNKQIIMSEQKQNIF